MKVHTDTHVGPHGLAHSGHVLQAALDFVAVVRRRWEWLLGNLDLPLAEAE